MDFTMQQLEDMDELDRLYLFEDIPEEDLKAHIESLPEDEREALLALIPEEVRCDMGASYGSKKQKNACGMSGMPCSNPQWNNKQTTFLKLNYWGAG